jgi:hypothetical protein
VPLVRIRRGADPDLIVRHPDGYHTAIAMSWTDFGTTPPPPSTTALPPLLALAGLRQTVAFLEHLRHVGRWPLPESAVPPVPAARYDEEV